MRRVAAVFDMFLSTPGELGVAELAAELCLSKSVVHRLVKGLADTQYLIQNPTSRRYSLGPKMLRLGLTAVGQSDMRERVLAHLHALAEGTGESATFSILAGDHRVYAEQVESTQVIRQTVQVGQSAPLYLGASGKAMLAFLTELRRDAVIAGAGRSTPPPDGKAIDTEALQKDLQRTRQLGFATSQSERIHGAASAAAPVFDHSGNVLGALSVAGVTIRQDQATLEAFGEMALAHAQALSTELGWPGPSDTNGSGNAPARQQPAIIAAAPRG